MKLTKLVPCNNTCAIHALVPLDPASVPTTYATPVESTPMPVPGIEYVRARVAGRGTYDGGNKPYVDFNAVVAGTDRTRQFVHDDRAGLIDLERLHGASLGIRGRDALP